MWILSGGNGQSRSANADDRLSPWRCFSRSALGCLGKMLIFYENRASQGQVQGAGETGQDVLVAVILEVTGTLGTASDPWVARREGSFGVGPPPHGVSLGRTLFNPV